MGMKMVLRKFYIRTDQDKSLEILPGNKAENVRIAIDDYLEKKVREMIDVSDSPSKRGGQDGRTSDVPSTEEK